MNPALSKQGSCHNLKEMDEELPFIDLCSEPNMDSSQRKDYANSPCYSIVFNLTWFLFYNSKKYIQDIYCVAVR